MLGQGRGQDTDTDPILLCYVPSSFPRPRVNVSPCPSTPFSPSVVKTTYTAEQSGDLCCENVNEYTKSYQPQHKRIKSHLFLKLSCLFARFDFFCSFVSCCPIFMLHMYCSEHPLQYKPLLIGLRDWTTNPEMLIKITLHNVWMM